MKAGIAINEIFKKKILMVFVVVAIILISLLIYYSFDSNTISDYDENLNYFFVCSDIFLSKINIESNENTKKILMFIESGQYENALNSITNLEKHDKNNLHLKNLKAICYAGLSKYNESKKELEECLILAEENEINKNFIFNNLASLNIISFNLNEARNFFNKIKINDKNCLLYICYQYNLARCFGEENKIDFEKQYHEKNLKLLKSKFSNEKKILYFSKIFLATTNDNMSKNWIPIREIEENIKYLQKELGENHPEIASLYNLLGNLYYTKKDYVSSGNSILKALEIQKISLPENHFEFTYTYNNLNVTFADMNEFEYAKNYALKSFQISLNYPDNHVNFAGNLNNTGAMYFQLKDYKMAIQYFLKCYYISSTDDYLLTLQQMSLNNIKKCYIQLGYEQTKFDEWLNEQTRDMTKDKIYAEMEDIINGSDWD